MPGTWTHAAAGVAVAGLLGAGAGAPVRADVLLLAAGDIGKCTPAAGQGPYLTADLLAARPEAPS